MTILLIEGLVKQQRPESFILFAFWELVLPVPSAQMAAEETPVPSATPATTGAAGISPTPSPAETPHVRWVGVYNGKNSERRLETSRNAATRFGSIFLISRTG